MNVNSYHVARAHTLATLLEAQTTVQSAQLVAKFDVPIKSEGFVEDEFFELISWLTILDSDGDTISCGQRDDLAAIKSMMQSAAGFESEGTKNYHNTSSLFVQRLRLCSTLAKGLEAQYWMRTSFLHSGYYRKEIVSDIEPRPLTSDRAMDPLLYAADYYMTLRRSGWNPCCFIPIQCR